MGSDQGKRLVKGAAWGFTRLNHAYKSKPIDRVADAFAFAFRGDDAGAGLCDGPELLQRQ